MKAMVVNLDSYESMPPLQSGALSPPVHSAGSSVMDMPVAVGKICGILLRSSTDDHSLER